MLSSLAAVSLLILAAVPTPPVAYEATPATLDFRIDRTAFGGTTLDTGWQPSSGPIQVRLVTHVGSGASLRALGAAHLGWSPVRALWLVGEPNGGLLSLDAGIQVEAYLRLHLEVPLGPTYHWEGLLPGAPNFDFRFAASSTFTPFLLTGQSPDRVGVKDLLPPKRLYSIPLTQAIIPIPGIGGTLDIDAGGTLGLLVHGLRNHFDADALTAHEGQLPWALPEGTVLHRSSTYDVEATWDGTLDLAPAVSVQVGPVHWKLAQLNLPIPLPERREVWESAALPAQFELPRVRLFVDELPLTLDADRVGTLAMGNETLGPRSVRVLRVENTGSAPLSGTLALQGSGFQVGDTSFWSLWPGQSRSTELSVDRASEGPVEGTLVLNTSDPLGPLTVRLSAEGVVAEPPVSASSMPGEDASSEPPPDRFLKDPGCGCSSGVDALGLVWFLGAGLPWLTRRKRMCLPSRT
jgi:hypothetical protein